MWQRIDVVFWLVPEGYVVNRNRPASFVSLLYEKENDRPLQDVHPDQLFNEIFFHYDAVEAHGQQEDGARVGPAVDDEPLE